MEAKKIECKVIYNHKHIYLSLTHRPQIGELIEFETTIAPIGKYIVKVIGVIHEEDTIFIKLICDTMQQP